MILSRQAIRREGIVSPLSDRTVFKGVSYGLGPASYDVRIDQDVVLPRHGFLLVSTMEKLKMPDYVSGEVKDKSTWARRGVSAYNTFIDPGFEGYMTIELFNNGPETVVFHRGQGVCQFVFHYLDEPTEAPYRGKYHNQPAQPVGAIDE